MESNPAAGTIGTVTPGREIGITVPGMTTGTTMTGPSVSNPPGADP
jgi:hypothetical protein